MLNRFLLALCLSGACVPSAFGQTHFHHAHLNSTDPKAAIEFYTTHLSGEKATFGGPGGIDAVWTQKSWLLFNKVKQPPPYEVVSPLFHIGWGAEDMKAEFERQSSSRRHEDHEVSADPDLRGLRDFVMERAATSAPRAGTRTASRFPGSCRCDRGWRPRGAMAGRFRPASPR